MVMFLIYFCSFYSIYYALLCAMQRNIRNETQRNCSMKSSSDEVSKDLCVTLAHQFPDQVLASFLLHWCLTTVLKIKSFVQSHEGGNA